MVGLVKILESNGIHPRQDIVDAITSSHDQMYSGTQSELYRPQLVHAATWAESNIIVHGDDGDETTNDKVLLMGWASLGKRTLGGPILGMFIVTERKFCFVRKEPDGSGDVEQVYDSGKIDNPSISGFLGLRKVTFSVASEEHTWERIQKDNAKRIMGYMK